MQVFGDYEFVTDQKSVDLILIDAVKEKYLGIDTENSGGLNVISDDLKLLLFQIEVNNKAYVIDARKVDLLPFKEILESEKHIKIVQNISYDYKILRCLRNIYLKNIYDPIIAESLLDAGISKGSRSLGALTFRYLDLKMDKDTGKEFINFPYDGEFTDDQIKYAANDVLVLPNIRKRQQMYIDQLNLNSIAELEFALAIPVAKMELNGIKLDSEKWRKTLNEVNKKVFVISNELRNVLPDPPVPPPKPVRLKKDGTPYANTAAVKPPPVLNLDSPQQLITACKKVGISFDRANKITRAGLTNSTTLKFAAKLYSDDASKSEIINNIISYRGLKQTVKSFGETLLSHVKEDGRIHARFNQNGTASGRFSSSEPNLQNIQKKGDAGKILRSCFVADIGHKFIIADYCLAEGTLVSTARGLVPIELVTEDDYVVQEDKTFRKVLRVADSGIKNVNSITTRHGYVIEATNEHKVRVIDENGNYVWKRFDDLQDADYVSLVGKTIVADLPYVSLPNVVFSHHNENKSIKVPEVLDEDTAEFIGYLTGDGSFEQSGIRLVVNEEDTDLFNYLENKCIKLFGFVSGTSQPNKGVYTQRLHSRPLGRWFGIIGASKEHVPFDLLRSRKSVVAAFLRGLFESDGCVTTDRISVASSRYSLMREVQDLLLGLGIPSTLRKTRTKLGSKSFVGWQVTINSDSFGSYGDVVGFLSVRKQTKLNSLITTIRGYNQSIVNFPNLKEKVRSLKLHGETRRLLNNTLSLGRPVSRGLAIKVGNVDYDVYKALQLNLLVNNCQYFDKVIEIENIGCVNTYDLQIDSTETFVANGFVVHNSQIELRIVAELSNDKNMLRILNDPRGDIHKGTASEMYNVKYDDVSDDLRRAAKTINFGLIYGMSEKGLSNNLSCSESEAAGHLIKYRNTYPTLMIWLDKVGEDSFQRGNTKTIGGRIRWFPTLNPNDDDYKSLVRFYKRVGKNHPVQGTSADMTKTSIVYIDRFLDKYHSKLVNTIHDELCIEVPSNSVLEVANLVKEEMIFAGQIFLKKVPILVDVKIRDCWFKDDGVEDGI